MDKRAGVSTPLFSIYSAKSTGIGDLHDLKLLADWCAKTGMSIIQLLPMNDVGFDFRPYDAQSTFALEPMYLSLQNISGISSRAYAKEIKNLREEFPIGRRVNYKIKQAKLDLLREMFKYSSVNFETFINQNQFWLRDYAAFKVLKEIHQNESWEQWEEKYRVKNPEDVQELEKTHAEQIRFHQWLQWQLFEQLSDVKHYAASKKIFLMGDLPFLVSRDSADVWAHQNYFKLHLSSGAPPDAFFAKGQRWGMPPYDWKNIAANHYDYLTQKVRYAENFYDFFRIDHVVGVFRLWTIPLSEPLENGGLNGVFDPPDEKEWEDHGRKILSVMIENAKMLPCAEDLGVVPECSYKVLEELAIPGMDVQRWTKEWGKEADFKAPAEYRKNSMAVISNHDMTSFNAWWEYEAGTVDGELFRRKALEKGLDYESLKEKLFDSKLSSHGRLRWKEEIASKEILLEILGRSHPEAWEFVDMHKESFGEKFKFWQYLGLPGKYEEKSSPDLVRTAIEKIHAAASVLSVQLLQDWLSLGDILRQEDTWEFRINFPGVTGDQNWSLVMPISLEEMNRMKLNRTLKALNQSAGRSL